MKKIIITSIVITSILAACKTAQKPVATKIDCSDKSVTYTADIKPMMEQYCTKCHNNNEKAGYNLLKLEFVKKGALNGELLGTIKHIAGYPAMPMMAEKMPQAAIDKIECWINNGMKE